MKRIIVLSLALILILSVCAYGDSAYISGGLRVGSTVLYGTYEQNGNRSDGAEPIEWLVLDTDGTHALLITSYGLEAKAFNDYDTSVIWTECSLRKWLNGTFFDSAFSAAEQGLIEESYCEADKNPGFEYSNSSGSSWDKVFILSATEANYYFKNLLNVKSCYPTTAAKQNGAFVNKSNGSCCWWLRTPGSQSNYACCISSNATNYVNYKGNDVRDRDNCVRPAMWVTLNTVSEDKPASQQAQATPEPSRNESSDGRYVSPYGRR